MIFKKEINIYLYIIIDYIRSQRSSNLSRKLIIIESISKIIPLFLNKNKYENYIFNNILIRFS